MFTFSDAASLLGLKSNKLRYWVKKNSVDFKNDCYEFNLSDLLQIFIRKKDGKSCRCLIILDIDEFVDEYKKYINYVKNLKSKKRVGSVSWTQSAIDCYNCNLECSKCFNQNICRKFSTDDTEPPMKSVVKKLLHVIGKPPVN